LERPDDVLALFPTVEECTSNSCPVSIKPPPDKLSGAYHVEVVNVLRIALDQDLIVSDPGRDDSVTAAAGISYATLSSASTTASLIATYTSLKAACPIVCGR
jgi:hypothetical protein